MNSYKLKTLFADVNENTQIWYSNKPPLLGGISMKISVTELNNKIGNGFNYTENIYVNDNLKIDSTRLHNKNYMKDELLKIIKNPFNDKLVLCYMDDKTGNGVFAREAIQVGEIVAIYSGELKVKGVSTQYGMDVDPESNYIIDAKNYGGIARFFQHLPFNINETYNQLVPLFKINPNLLKRYLSLVMAGDNLTTKEKKDGIQNVTDDILHNDGKKVFIEYLRHLKKEWQLQCLTLKYTSLNIVASENLVTEFSTIDGKPVAYLWAFRAIKPGEQLGFDYGAGFWYKSNQFPQLFDNKGEIIPQSDYEYTKSLLTNVIKSDIQ
jgi:hypothetical protein